MLLVVEGQGPQESSEAQPPSRDMSLVPPDDMRASRGICCCCCCGFAGGPGLARDTEIGAGGASGWLDMQVALMEIDCRPAEVRIRISNQNSNLNLNFTLCPPMTQPWQVYGSIKSHARWPVEINYVARVCGAHLALPHMQKQHALAWPLLQPPPEAANIPLQHLAANIKSLIQDPAGSLVILKPQRTIQTMLHSIGVV